MLEPNDRCDSCGSQAYVLVLFKDDMSLMFCGHHWNQHADALIEVAVDIVDETDKLNPRRETAPNEDQ